LKPTMLKLLGRTTLSALNVCPATNTRPVVIALEHDPARHTSPDERTARVSAQAAVERPADTCCRHVVPPDVPGMVQDHGRDRPPTHRATALLSEDGQALGRTRQDDATDAGHVEALAEQLAVNEHGQIATPECP
jgi:hypothetical protein